MDKTELKFVTAVIAFLIGGMVFMASRGEKAFRDKIETRALKLKDKDCYQWKDIEFVIYGETQN